MGKRKNLTYRETSKSNPFKQISVKVDLPAYILKDVHTFGALTKTVRERLIQFNRDRFFFSHREHLSEIAKTISLLEQWKEDGAIGNEKEIDQYHLEMLEFYRDIYARMRSFSKKKRNKKGPDK